MDARPDKRCPLWVPLSGLVLALCPILIMLVVSRSISPGDRFMWAIQYDQFYYAANARQMAQDGGVVYANAYDDRAEPHKIYSHLYPLLLSVASRVSGIEPVYCALFWSPVFGIFLALSLWIFLGEIFPDGLWRARAFACLMTTGGLTGLWAFLETCGGVPEGADFFVEAFARQFFQNEGTALDWLCSVGRVFLIPPETLYHAVWFAALAAYLKGRRVASTAWAALEVYAHPFTGPELALVLAAACLGDILCERDRRGAVLQLCGMAALLAGFAAYAFWLGTDSVHRAVQETWSHFKSPIPLDRYFLIYGIWLPLGVMAAVALRKYLKTDAGVRLMLIQAGVVFLLTHHHLFLDVEFQPAHFSRGYLMAALVVLGWKGLHASRIGRFFRPRLVAAGIALLSLDTWLYMVYAAVRAQDPPTTVTSDRAEVIREIAKLPGRQFVASDADIGYLLPVFSGHRVLLGHYGTTPRFEENHALWSAWLLGGNPSVFVKYPGLTVLVIPVEARGWLRTPVPQMEGWRIALRNASFLVYHLPRADGSA
ncbi:hypothetical protein HY522_02650 [bacterium]|nr:hypothetical protein [bacterium]